MPDTRILLDPTAQQLPARRERQPRPTTLDGLTIGLLDISKPRGNVFLDRLEAQLAGRGLTVKRFQKPTYARVAPTALKQKITTTCDVVIEALADWGSCTTCSVHDITDLESRGIPAIFVASTEFIEAAQAQATALGFDPAAVFVPHPIQDRTDEEMEALADQFLEMILTGISG